MLIFMGDYGVLDCENEDVDLALTVMQAALNANVSLSTKVQMNHIQLGHSTRTSQLFFSSEEIYMLRRTLLQLITTPL